MSTLLPPDLLLRWTQEDLTVEQAVGYLVQIINTHHQQLQETRQQLREVKEQLAAQSTSAPKSPPKPKKS